MSGITGSYTKPGWGFDPQGYSHAYYLQNRDARREYSRMWQTDNRERYQKSRHESYQRKMEALRAQRQEWQSDIYPTLLISGEDGKPINIGSDQQTAEFLESHTLLEAGFSRYVADEDYLEWFDALSDERKVRYLAQIDEFLGKVAALDRLLRMGSFESASEMLDHLITSYGHIWRAVGLKLDRKLED